MFKFPKDASFALLESVEQNARLLEEIKSLRQQLNDADESLKAVEKALANVDYRGSYADGVMYLKGQLAETEKERNAFQDQCIHLKIKHGLTQDSLTTALAACEAWKEVAEDQYGKLRASLYGDEDYPVKGALDAYAAGRHQILAEAYNTATKHCAAAIRELKGNL